MSNATVEIQPSFFDVKVVPKATKFSIDTKGYTLFEITEPDIFTAKIIAGISYNFTSGSGSYHKLLNYMVSALMKL